MLVDELREKCLEERQDLGASGSSSSAIHYSSLTTAPDDWRLDGARPCSGERLLLMFDRYNYGFISTMGDCGDTDFTLVQLVMLTGKEIEQQKEHW